MGFVSRETLRIGERAWRRLVAGGGFVWTAADGSMSIHFNRGYKPTQELAEVVRRYRQELRLFVRAMHGRDEARRALPTSPGIGTSSSL